MEIHILADGTNYKLDSLGIKVLCINGLLDIDNKVQINQSHNINYSIIKIGDGNMNIMIEKGQYIVLFTARVSCSNDINDSRGVITIRSNYQQVYSASAWLAYDNYTNSHNIVLSVYGYFNLPTEANLYIETRPYLYHASQYSIIIIKIG